MEPQPPGGWIERAGWRLAAAAIARPRRFLAVGLLLSLALAPGLFRLELATDGRSLVPPDDPAIAVDRLARETFGLRDPLLVVLDSDHPRGIYTAETLGLLARLSAELAALPGIGEENVVSLATERRSAVDPATGDFRRFFDPPPATPGRLAEIRYEAESLAGYRGTLVSTDGTAAAIRVGVPFELEGGAPVDRGALHRRISALTARFATPEVRVHVVGSPAAEALLGDHLLADLRVLLPLALAVIAAVLWGTCGRIWGAAVGLFKIGMAQAATLGLLGWLGEPLYLTTAVTPVILTSVGLADEIHILWELQQRLGGGNGALVPALRAALKPLVRPVILTSLTTAVGFASFATSSIRPVAAFGLLTAFGVLFCLAWALAVTPALLALLPATALAPRSAPAFPAGRVRAWSGRLIARRRPIWALLGVATLLLGAGVTRLEVQDSWLENFSPASELRRASALVDRKLAGTHVLEAVIRFDPPEAEVPVLYAARGPLLAGRALRAVGAFEAAARAEPGVGGVHGLHEMLLDLAYAYSGRQEGSRLLSDLPAWIYLHIRRIALARGEARRRELIDDDYSATVVTIFLRDANYRRTAQLMRRLRDHERSYLRPAHGRLEFAGDIALSQAMIPAIVRTQMRSVVLAVLGNFLLCASLTRSASFAALVTLPTAIGVLWTFGLMGWLGLPLGVATSMFCAITLGIGIDFGIHLLARRRAAAAAADPTVAALAGAGPAIVIDTLAIALGFGLLAFSTVPANARLGLLTAAALASTCVLTLLGLGVHETKYPKSQ